MPLSLMIISIGPLQGRVLMTLVEAILMAPVPFPILSHLPAYVSVTTLLFRIHFSFLPALMRLLDSLS